MTDKKNFVVDFKKRRGRRNDDLIVAADCHDIDRETSADFQFEQVLSDDSFRRLHGNKTKVGIEFHVFHDVAGNKHLCQTFSHGLFGPNQMIDVDAEFADDFGVVFALNFDVHVVNAQVFQNQCGKNRVVDIDARSDDDGIVGGDADFFQSIDVGGIQTNRVGDDFRDFFDLFIIPVDDENVRIEFGEFFDQRITEAADANDGKRLLGQGYPFFQIASFILTQTVKKSILGDGNASFGFSLYAKSCIIEDIGRFAMNEYSDLFQPQQKPNITKDEPNRDPSLDYEERHKDQTHNKWTFLLYFLVYIVLIGAMGFYFASIYPNPNDSINQIQWIEQPAFVVTDEVDELGFRKVVFTGSIENQNPETIEAFQLSISFTDDNDTLLYEMMLTKEQFEPSEVWVIEESFFVAMPPSDVDVLGNLYVSNLTNVLFSVAQGVLLIGIFFSMQWLHVKRQFRRFIQDWKKNLGYIVIGVALVYAAVFVGGMLLQAFGVNDTSQNEMAIQQMFQNDPLVLWLLFFTLCIAAPITEEFVFRKAIFGFVEPKWGVAPAILISSLVFGSMHVLGGGDWIQIIPYALMGSAFGYIYHLSGRNLLVVIVMHFVNNFIVFLLYLPGLRDLLLSISGISL